MHIDVHGLHCINTADECGLNDIKAILDTILTSNIKAIFFETSVFDKSMCAILTGCDKNGHYVSIAGYLYMDTPRAVKTLKGTYLRILHANIHCISNALK